MNNNRYKVTFPDGNTFTCKLELDVPHACSHCKVPGDKDCGFYSCYFDVATYQFKETPARDVKYLMSEVRGNDFMKNVGHPIHVLRSQLGKIELAREY